MLNLCRVVFFLVCTALAACGGGGGSSGAVPNAGDLRTTAGGAVSMAVGSVQSYDVQGGVPPYRLGGNTAPELVMASVNGSVLIIRTVSAGSVVVTVLDNSGKSVVIRVNAGASTPLTTTVPSPLQIASAATISTFTVSGGRAPYSVVSSDGNIARGSISGSMFSITGVAIGSTTLNILDSDGSTVSVTVNVGSSTPLNTTVPSPLQLANESTVGNFSVFGGRAPYSVVSSDANIARGSISGSALSITGVAIGSTTLTIRDSDGLAVSVTVNVGSSTSLSTTLPSPLQLANGTTINDFKVSGGRAPYSVVSSDISIVRASITGSALSVTGVGIGSTVLTIRDSDGLITRATVNVGAAAQLFWNAPADLTLQPGLSQTYLISGGSVPYRITSSAPAVASSDEIVGTTVRINAHKVGTATFRLTDAQGSEKLLEVNVVADGSGAVVSAAPQLRNAALSSSDGSIAASGPTTLSVTLTDPSGRGIANQLINFKDESADGKLTFPEGTTALTNASGVASIKVARSSLTAVGAGSVSISYNYRAGALTTYPDGSRPPAVDTLVSTFVGYQLATANVTLTNLRVLGATGLPLSLAAYGTSQVTVQANLNGTPSATPVQVNFAATCGQISPAVASTNSAGIATASYSATDAAGTTVSTLGCSDKTVEISASTTGALPSTQALNITGAAATNMSFVDASPARIYLANSGGVTQSIVRFKLVNARGEVLLGKDVVLTLKTTNGGVPKASFGTPGNLSPITATTDAAGLVSVPVFSGTVPTSVVVNAALKPVPPAITSSVQTDSAALTIASGRPAQARVSLALEKFSIEGASVDGDQSGVTLSLADRQGNPVPDGTDVNFVTSGGVMIPPVCVTGVVPGDSRCTVQIRSQNPRLDVPKVSQKGYVEILAYSAGEEDFVDLNFDNQYVPADDGARPGTDFLDLTTAFRDDNKNGQHDAGEFSVPRSGATTLMGDGKWGAADVRTQSTMIFATSKAVFSNPSASTSSASVTIADGNGNSMPTGSTVKAVGLPLIPLSKCGIGAGSPFIIPNTLGPVSVAFGLIDCLSGDAVVVEIKTLFTGTVTSIQIPIP